MDASDLIVSPEVLPTGSRAGGRCGARESPPPPDSSPRPGPAAWPPSPRMPTTGRSTPRSAAIHYGSANQIEQTLAQGYIAAACAAKGFVAYFTVDDGNGTLATVAVFESQKAFEDFADDEANWIAQNLSSLPSPDETIAGQTAVSAGAPQTLTCPAGPQPTAAAPTAAAPTATAAAPTATAAAPTATAAAPTPTPLPVCTDPSRPGVGCACTTGTNNPCGDNTLLCYATPAPRQVALAPARRRRWAAILRVRRRRQLRAPVRGAPARPARNRRVTAD